MSITFQALGIRSDLVQVLKENRLTTATPVQEAVIPLLLSGKDAIAQAQTGTGKTLAFVLPIMEAVNTEQAHVQALIITPTRELAIQITAEIKKLAPAVGASVLAAYGGQDVEGQIHKLKGASHIVVGTPGRLLDHLGRGTLSLGRARMLVLDEADQMLNMGFLSEVERIIEHMPNQRQTMLFSATMPEPIRQLAARYMRKPEDVRIQGKAITLEEIRQVVVETTDRGKQAALFRFIEEHRPFLALVFCRTKMRVKKLTAALVQEGFQADELHGDLSQAKREQVMRRFKAAKLQILVATDVAARGLDVTGVTHVFNYDVPRDGEDYIHRIGRTGRAGHRGVAVTFATSKDRMKLQLIDRRIGNALEYQGAESGTASKGRAESSGRRSKGAGSRGARGSRRDRGGGGAVGGAEREGRRGRGGGGAGGVAEREGWRDRGAGGAVGGAEREGRRGRGGGGAGGVAEREGRRGRADGGDDWGDPRPGGPRERSERLAPRPGRAAGRSSRLRVSGGKASGARRGASGATLRGASPRGTAGKPQPSGHNGRRGAPGSNRGRPRP